MGMVYKCDTCGAICDGVTKRVYAVSEVMVAPKQGPFGPAALQHVFACEDCVPDAIKDAIQRHHEYAEQQFRERLVEDQRQSDNREIAAGRLGPAPGTAEVERPPV